MLSRKLTIGISGASDLGRRQSRPGPRIPRNRRRSGRLAVSSIRSLAPGATRTIAMPCRRRRYAACRRFRAQPAGRCRRGPRPPRAGSIRTGRRADGRAGRAGRATGGLWPTRTRHSAPVVRRPAPTPTPATPRHRRELFVPMGPQVASQPAATHAGPSPRRRPRRPVRRPAEVPAATGPALCPASRCTSDCRASGIRRLATRPGPRRRRLRTGASDPPVLRQADRGAAARRLRRRGPGHACRRAATRDHTCRYPGGPAAVRREPDPAGNLPDVVSVEPRPPGPCRRASPEP